MKFLYFFLVLLFNSCSIENEKIDVLNEKPRKLYISNEDNYSDFNSAIKILEEIILSVDEDHIISNIRQLCVINDAYIVSDSRGKQLLVFNKYGKFERSIGNIGSGPGEFESLTSIDINSKSQIMVFDATNLRLSYFDLEGYYLSSLNVIQGFCLSSNSKGGFFIYNSSLPSSGGGPVIDYYSEEGKLISRFCSSFFDIPAVGANLITSNAKGDIFLVHPSVYKIIRISDNYSSQLEFGRIPKFYKGLSIKDGQLPSLKAINEATTLRSIYSNNKLVFVELFCSETQNRWIDIYTVDGDLVIGVTNVLDELYLADVDELNNLYFIKSPTIISDSPNFSLSDYEIVKCQLIENNYE